MRQWTKSASIGNVKAAMQTHYGNDKRIGNFSILLAEDLVVREAILTKIQKGIQQIIFQNDS